VTREVRAGIHEQETREGGREKEGESMHMYIHKYIRAPPPSDSLLSISLSPHTQVYRLIVAAPSVLLTFQTVCASGSLALENLSVIYVCVCVCV
jgi:hypothetical protein